jgi:hypothetical protein
MSEHYWYKSFTPEGIKQAGPANFLLIFFIVYLAYLTLGDLVTYIMNCCCKRFSLEDFEINEDIEPYQDCLDNDDKEFTEKEE